MSNSCTEIRCWGPGYFLFNCDGYLLPSMFDDFWYLMPSHVMRRMFRWSLGEQLKLICRYFFTGVATILPTMDIGLIHQRCLVDPSDGCLVRIRVCFCTLWCRPMALDGFLTGIWIFWIYDTFPWHWNTTWFYSNMVDDIGILICSSSSWHVMMR